MKTIYPQETLDLLAEMDKLMNAIIDDYQREYPDPPDTLREMIGELRYAEKFYEARDKRRRATLGDPIYQACIRQKAKIVMISPCSYQLDADEVQQLSRVPQAGSE